MLILCKIILTFAVNNIKLVGKEFEGMLYKSLLHLFLWPNCLIKFE